MALKTTFFGKSERRKVVDNLMNLIFKKNFAVFGSVLREIRLFKVRMGTCPAPGNSKIKTEVGFLVIACLNLKLMRFKAKISMEMSRNMSTME